MVPPNTVVISPRFDENSNPGWFTMWKENRPNIKFSGKKFFVSRLRVERSPFVALIVPYWKKTFPKDYTLVLSNTILEIPNLLT